MAAGLPQACLVVDHFHVIRLANVALDEVRRRTQLTTSGHRGRKADPLYRIRRRLLASHDRLDPAAFARMLAWLNAGDPQGEVGAAYLAKEPLRDTYLAGDALQARRCLVAFSDPANHTSARRARYDRPVAGSRSLLAPASFLGMLDPEDRAALIGVGRPRRYNRGATIVIQGDHSDTVFVVVAGRVKVSAVTPDGREIMLAVDGPGDLLGEFEAVDPDSGPRTAANVALEPVECRELTGEEFRGVLQSHPRIALMLLGWIIRRLKAADRRRIDATSLDTTHRLARFLLELADNHAQADPPRVDIDIPLTQEELASLIAASRDTVVRAITSLRSRGFIATARRRITILDINALRQYAE